MKAKQTKQKSVEAGGESQPSHKEKQMITSRDIQVSYVRDIQDQWWFGEHKKLVEKAASFYHPPADTAHPSQPTHHTELEKTRQIIALINKPYWQHSEGTYEELVAEMNNSRHVELTAMYHYEKIKRIYRKANLSHLIFAECHLQQMHQSVNIVDWHPAHKNLLVPYLLQELIMQKIRKEQHEPENHEPEHQEIKKQFEKARETWSGKIVTPQAATTISQQLTQIVEQTLDEIQKDKQVKPHTSQQSQKQSIAAQERAALNWLMRHQLTGKKIEIKNQPSKTSSTRTKRPYSTKHITHPVYKVLEKHQENRKMKARIVVYLSQILGKTTGFIRKHLSEVPTQNDKND